MNYETSDILKYYKHCFLCGGELKHSEHNHFICTECGYNLYVNPTPTTGVILENEEGEILLVERKIDPGKGLWDTPGGFIDLDESAEVGMRREIKEELGIEVGELKYLGSYADTYFWDKSNLATIGLVYTGTISKNQEINVSDDVAGFKFFNKEELPLDKIAFSGAVNALNDYLNFHR